MAFKKKSKFSASQKQAYYSGMGYAVRHDNRNVNFKGGRGSKGYNSFMAGYLKGVEMMTKNPSKYPYRDKK